MMRALGVLALALAVGCGSSSKSSSSTGSSTSVQCNDAARGVCLTLSAPAISGSQKTALQTECTTDGGTFADGTCSTANAVAGTCTATDPSALTSVAVSDMSIKGTYATAQWNATTAAADCAGWGTWAGGGGGGGGSVTLSCTWAGDGCQQLTGTITGAEQTSIQTSCTGSGGSFVAAACGTAGMLSGSCFYANGNDIAPFDLAGATTGRTYYATAGWTLPEAQTDCAAPPAGVWQ